MLESAAILSFPDSSMLTVDRQQDVQQYMSQQHSGSNIPSKTKEAAWKYGN